jgi:peptide-methionine (R)-S-oxide reductase
MGSSSSNAVPGNGANEPAAQPRVVKSKTEWQAQLTPEQFRVVREKGTERPGTGKYDKHKESGVYREFGLFSEGVLAVL